MASISLNSVTTDNKINSVEATSALPLSGTSSGIAAGSLVSIFVDGASTPAAYSFLNADGSWHAVLDATQFAEGGHTVTASVASASVSSTQTVTVDTLDPAMTIAAPDAALSNAGTVHYDITFGEAPVSVAAANFGLATTGTIAGASVTDVTAIDGTHYTVTVDTGTGDGTIALTTTGLTDAAGNGMAGVAFQEQTLQTPAGDVYAMRSGDVNGDGRPDLVSVGSSGIGVWLQSLDGTFAFQQYNGQNFSSGRVVDVNNDGKLDLVATGIGSGLSVFLGNGDGTFSLPASFSGSTVARPIGVATADFNGDGKVDFAVNSSDSSNNAYVTIYLGAGDGSFVQASTYATGGGDPAYFLPDDIENGDLNGDGVADIVATTRYSNGVTVLLGHGDGTFANPVVYATGIALSNGVALGDLNGDGKLDVIAAGYEQSGLAVFLNHGDGTLEAPTLYASNVYQKLEIADIDGDGILDVVAAGGSNVSDIQIFRGAGDGTLQTPTSYPTTYTLPNGPAIADFNGDGKLDIAAAGNIGGFNPGAGVFLSIANGPAYTLDRTPPAAPSTPDLTDDSDSALNSDNITSVNTPTFTGTAEASATVTLYDTDGATVLGTTTADASTGAWSITASTLIDGDHTVTATATDAVGNVSDPSTGLTVHIDTVTPVVAAPDLDAASDTGRSNTDNITKDNTPTFIGTTEAGATVTLFDTDGTTVLGTATANGTTGAWSITTGTLADGNHTVTVQAADAAGNVSAVSPGLTVTIDTTAPAVPTVVLSADRAVDGYDHVSSVGTVRGIVSEAGDQITYSADGGITFLGTAPIYPHDGSQDGIKTIQVRETDAAGNATTTSIEFNLDTLAPDIVSFEAITSSPTNAGTVQFHLTMTEPVFGIYTGLFHVTGAAAAGASVTSVDLVSGTDDEYIVTVATGPNDGPLGLSFDGASVTDHAGNHLPPKGGLALTNFSDSVQQYWPDANMATGDLNGDGNADFVEVYSVYNYFIEYFGNGDGTFQAPVLVPSPGQISGAFALTDLNDDGYSDLVVHDDSGNGFNVFFAIGDGTFQSAVRLHLSGDGPPGAFAVADFTGDGRPDIYTVTNGETGLWTNDGHNGFSGDYAPSVGYLLQTADFNADGKADLSFIVGNSLVVRLGNGDGTFMPDLTSVVGASATPGPYAFADVNGDHKLDIVTSNYDGTVTAMLGAGDGTFTAANTYTAGASTGAIALADFNGDGNIDIAVVDPDAEAVKQLLGNGDGTFRTGASIDIYSRAYGMALADFNGDGGLDIVTKGTAIYEITILRNTSVPADAATGYVMDKTITASNAVDHHLVEATSSSAGTASAVATITIASDTSYDTTALTSGGWTNAGGGLWTHASTYGTATLDTAANTLTFALDNGAADILVPADHLTASFTIPVRDTAGNMTTTVVTFTIDGANDAPTLTATNAGTLNDTGAPDTFAALTGSLAGHDVDGGALLTYDLAPGQNAVGAYGRLTLYGDGAYRYVANSAAIDALPAGAPVTDAFNVSVSDGTATTLSTLSVTINGANDLPVFTRTSLSLAENATLIAPLASMATDADGPNSTTITITGGADAALFDIIAGNLVFRAPHDYESEPHSYHLELTASDGTDSSIQTVTVALTDVNDNAPVFTSATSATEPENTAVSAVVYTAHATDADGTLANSTIAYALTGDDAALFSIDASTGDVRFRVSPNYEAPQDLDRDNHYQITVHANDGVHDATQDVAIAATDVSELFQWDSSTDLGARQTAMQVAGVGDFNGDATADLLWRNAATGQIDEWRMQDGNWSSSADLGARGTGWQVAGIGDFNGDGTDDILWRETASGKLDAWIMQNGQWSRSVDLGARGTDWKVIGVGDFDGDLTDDILFQNTTTGAVDQWQMANGNWAHSMSLGSHNLAWSSSAVGDFDGDGTSDVLWRNPTSGQVEEWHMKDGNWAGSIDLGSVSTAYDLAAVSDFNGDRVSDVLWRAPASGRVDGWVMHDGNWLNSVSLGAFNPAYALAGTGDFDHVGGADVLWHDAETGQINTWLLRSI